MTYEQGLKLAAKRLQAFGRSVVGHAGGMTDPKQSQCGEDSWLESNWPHLDLPDRDGFFVELGAGDGIYLSNTFWLEQVKGWRGLLIEGDPRNVVKPRDGCIVERAIIGPPGVVSFGLHPTDTYLSGVAVKAPSRFEAQTRTLSDVLTQHEIARVDLISIDVEGNEIEVWKTLDLRRWRPTVAIVELHTWKLPDRSEEVIAVMREDGYEMIYQTALNGIFKARND